MGQALRVSPHVLETRDAAGPGGGKRALDQAGHQQVNQLAQGFVESLAFRSTGELGFHCLVDLAILRYGLGHVLGPDQAGGPGIVEVGRIVRHLVGRVDQLGFQGRAQSRQVGVQLGALASFEIARVFDDSFADFEAQIQSGKAGVALFEAFDNPQGVQVVVESLAEPLHFAVQRLLSGVGERRVPDIMGQRQGFGEILVQLQDVGQGARDLRDFDGVGETVAEMVGQAGSEDLRFGLQAAKGTGMNHAVAVALESVAVGMFGFGVLPPPASLYRKSQARQHEKAAAIEEAVRPAG